MPLIAQLTDTHIMAGGALAYGRVDTLAFLRAAVEHLNTFTPRLSGVVISGDLVDRGTPDDYAVASAALDRLAVPWWPIPGNHDGPAFYTAFADTMVDPVPGVGHIVTHEGVRIVLLDTRVDGAPHGELDTTRAAWLELALATPTTLLAMHHPPVEVGISHMDTNRLRDVARLREIIAATPPRAILCGHIHRTILTTFEGVPLVVAPSPAHAVSLDLGADAPSTFHMEPPGVMVHKIEDERVVSHVSFIGNHAGPFAFY